MARKGLFHIVEIVIIAIVMFFMLSQASVLPEPGGNWPRARLSTRGIDALHSLKESGLDLTDSGQVRDFLNYTFQGTQVRYELEYAGVPQEQVSVGCLCDGSASCNGFCVWLRGLLRGMGQLTFNGFPVEFRVVNTSRISNIYDVMATNMRLTGLDSEVVNYLEDGKGFVLAKDLSHGDFTSYGSILEKYFAVNESGGADAGQVRFNEMGLTFEPEYYPIQRYFAAIPNASGHRYAPDHEFSDFAGDTVGKAFGPEGLEVLVTPSGHPAGVAKVSASGNQGRSAWLSGSSREDDWSILLAAMILWSSEHRRGIAGNELGRVEASATAYWIPEDTSRADHIFQPIEMVLRMGYLYS